MFAETECTDLVTSAFTVRCDSSVTSVEDAVLTLLKIQVWDYGLVLYAVFCKLLNA